MSTVIPGHTGPLPPKSVSITAEHIPTTEQNDDASYRLPEYTWALPRWSLTRAACQGEEAVKQIADILPTLNPDDTTPSNIARNAAYLRRAVYYNAVGRTLEGLVGLAFARDPEVELGPFMYMTDDSDGTGRSIYHIAQDSLSNVLQTGGHGLLVDMVNDQPGIISYPRESIINWRIEAKDGRRRLTLLVLFEIVKEPKGQYGLTEYNQYREYRLVDGRVKLSVWRSEVGKSVLESVAQPVIRLPSAVKELDFIPFVFIGAQSNSPEIDSAPLNALADMNLAHFRNSADYEESVFFCGQVQPWISGLSEEWRDWLHAKGMYVGSRNPLLLPADGAFGMEQAEPNTLAKEAMDSKKELMVALGARVVEENKVTKTATQAAGDIATGTSVLGLCCANVSEGMTLALRICGLFRNATVFKDAKFNVTKDFNKQVATPEDIDAMVKAWQARAFSKKDLRDYLRRSGVISVERTDEMIDQELEQEPDLAMLELESKLTPPENPPSPSGDE